MAAAERSSLGHIVAHKHRPDALPLGHHHMVRRSQRRAAEVARPAQADPAAARRALEERAGRAPVRAAGIFEPEGSVTAYFLAATSPVIARSEATKQSIAPRADDAWIASLRSQ